MWKHLSRVLAGCWILALRKGTGETRRSLTAKQICDGMLKAEDERKREKEARVCRRGLLPIRPFKAKGSCLETGRERTSLRLGEKTGVRRVETLSMSDDPALN